MTLLTICQDAARELKIGVPSAIVASTSNQDAMLLLRLAKKEIFSLSRRFDWNRLRKEHTFNTVAADSQAAASVPSDYMRLIESTMYNRTDRRFVSGPLTPQEWQEYKTGLITMFDPSFIVRGNIILLAPLQTAGRAVYYEYLSNLIVATSAVATPTLTTWTADTNFTIWPEEIITQGIIWRWRKHKGMAFEDERLDYERYVADEMIMDGGKPRIDLTRTRGMSVKRGRAQIRDYNTI